MSQSTTVGKGDNKAEKRNYAQRVFGWKKKSAPTGQIEEKIDPAVFVLAHQFGDLMREPAYAELPSSEKARLRQPVEQAIQSKDATKVKDAIGTFKDDLKVARENQVKSVNKRIADDRIMVDALTSRGSHGAKRIDDLLKTAKSDAEAGKVGAASAGLDSVEAAILNDVGAHIGLAEARINSLSDWGSPEAGGLENRVKALRSTSTLATFDATFRGYDTLMRDVAAAASAPVQQKKTGALDELRKGIVAGLAGVPDAPPPQPTPPPRPGGTAPTPPPRGGDTPTPPPQSGGTPPVAPRRGGLMVNRRPPPIPQALTKPALQGRFDVWDDDLNKAKAETDAKKKETALDTLDTGGTKLYADILKAKGGDTKAEREAVYKKALEARYDFTIDTKGRDFTNLDKMYEVLRMVPPEDVSQAQMKVLTYYDPGKTDSAAFGGATIYMGDYGDAKGDWGYTNPDGTPAPANGFGISALHELGHSIDARNGIMASNRGKSGCGTWEPESVASVTEVVFTGFRFGPGKDSAIPEATMRSLISTSLVNGTPAKPTTVSDTDWGPMKTVLDTCAKLRADEDPWQNPSPIGSRAYHQAYKESNEWWSYDPGARGGTTVRPYQWRSPAEWFAELYAFSNFKKQKPPSGIDAGVAVFMWKS